MNRFISSRPQVTSKNNIAHRRGMPQTATRRLYGQCCIQLVHDLA